MDIPALPRAAATAPVPAPHPGSGFGHAPGPRAGYPSESPREVCTEGARKARLALSGRADRAHQETTQHPPACFVSTSAALAWSSSWPDMAMRHAELLLVLPARHDHAELLLVVPT